MQSKRLDNGENLRRRVLGQRPAQAQSLLHPEKIRRQPVNSLTVGKLRANRRTGSHCTVRVWVNLPAQWRY